MIGGEPSYYCHLIEILEFIKQHKMKITLVINGYRFSDKTFIKEVEDLLDNVGFSIKAANKKQYRKLICADAFEKI